jgi:hypothetical protein
VRWTFAATAATMVVAGMAPTFVAPRHRHADSVLLPAMPRSGRSIEPAGMGFSPTNPTESSRRDINSVAAELGHSLIDGIILGGNVGPYLSGLGPAHIKSRVAASAYASAR